MGIKTLKYCFGAALAVLVILTIVRSTICDYGIPCRYSWRNFKGEPKCEIVDDIVSDYQANLAAVSLVWLQEVAPEWCPDSEKLRLFLEKESRK